MIFEEVIAIALMWLSRGRVCFSGIILAVKKKRRDKLWIFSNERRPLTRQQLLHQRANLAGLEIE